MLSMNEAVKRLRKAGYKLEFLERRSLTCHRAEAHYVVFQKRGRYSEAVIQALEAI